VTLPSDAFRLTAIRAHEPLRTYHPRRSPLSQDREDSLETYWPQFGFSVHDAEHPYPTTPDGRLDTVALFGREAPVVVEIGSGMGETTAAMAAADPGRDYLALEAHLPGIASLLGFVGQAGLTNVRVGHGDALDLLRRVVAPDSLDAVHVYFPDPWPKNKHHKRRLIQATHVDLLRSRLRVGGTLHCATDWLDYAEQMRDVLEADSDLESSGLVARPAHRPVTKFEQRGLDLGHVVHDVIARRIR